MSFRIAGAIAMLISSGSTAASCMPRKSPRILAMRAELDDTAFDAALRSASKIDW